MFIRRFDLEQYQKGGNKKSSNNNQSAKGLSVWQRMKNQLSNHFDSNKEDSLIEDLIEIVDPTGISSWDDVARSYKKEGLSLGTAIEAFGALPLIGKVGKGAKYLGRAIDLTRASKGLNRNTKMIEKVISRVDPINLPFSKNISKFTGNVVSNLLNLKTNKQVERAQNKISKINLANVGINLVDNLSNIVSRAVGSDDKKVRQDSLGNKISRKLGVLENTFYKYGKPQGYNQADNLLEPVSIDFSQAIGKSSGAFSNEDYKEGVNYFLKHNKSKGYMGLKYPNRYNAFSIYMQQNPDKKGDYTPEFRNMLNLYKKTNKWEIKK